LDNLHDSTSAIDISPYGAALIPTELEEGAFSAQFLKGARALAQGERNSELFSFATRAGIL
jgi:hypothetical protein